MPNLSKRKLMQRRLLVKMNLKLKITISAFLFLAPFDLFGLKRKIISNVKPRSMSEIPSQIFKKITQPEYR